MLCLPTKVVNLVLAQGWLLPLDLFFSLVQCITYSVIPRSLTVIKGNLLSANKGET